MLKLYESPVPVPCSITSCLNSDATVQLVSEGHPSIAICGECVYAMAQMCSREMFIPPAACACGECWLCELQREAAIDVQADYVAELSMEG